MQQTDLNGNPIDLVTIPKHELPSLVDDEFETPDELFYWCMDKVKLVGEEVCELDVFAMKDRGDGKSNSKCIEYLTIEDNALECDWLVKEKIRGTETTRVPKSVWVNDLHSNHVECLIQLVKQHKKYGFTVVAIMPSNTRRPKYWDQYIEPYRFGGDPKYKNIKKHIYNFPVSTGAIRFLRKGLPSVNEKKESKSFGKPQTSRNSYEVLIWKKRH